MIIAKENITKDKLLEKQKKNTFVIHKKNWYIRILYKGKIIKM